MYQYLWDPFARKGAVIDDVVINHESIHSKQMKELLWIFFYFLYVFEFIVHLVKLKDWHKAYKNISLKGRHMTMKNT